MSKRAMVQDKQPSLAAYLWAAAISAAVGFAAVYVTLGGSDNAGRVPPAEKSAESSPSAPQATRGSDAAAPTANQMAAFVKTSPPQPLPDVEFTGKDGVPVKLSDFKGRTVLLNLWATWCAPCRKEMPSLDRLQKAMGSEAFEVVALAVDRGGAEAAAKFLADIKVENLKLYVDATARSGTALKALGMPATILIDKEGREAGRLTGPAEWDSEEAKALVKSAM